MWRAPARRPRRKRGRARASWRLGATDSRGCFSHATPSAWGLRCVRPGASFPTLTRTSARQKTREAVELPRTAPKALTAGLVAMWTRRSTPRSVRCASGAGSDSATWTRGSRARSS
eukprot:Amastigsp_a1037_23.p3 type:complete len:116 gc:universal Amastigsp_a1037_23:808-461(-)